jgi:hypothetical protein
MKNILLLAVAATLLTACGEKKLSADQAKTLLQKDRGYPKPLTFEINRIDPASVRRLELAGMEQAGMVTLDKSRNTPPHQPRIFFTEKAKPFLLGSPEGRTAEQAENVKVADMDIAKVTGIATSKDGKTAAVNYLIGYSNLTPFKTLIPNVEESVAKKEYFRLYDDGWRVDKSAAMNMN